MPTPLIFALAAVAEIAGCFAFFAWMRQGASPWWLIPGVASLIAFGWLLSLVDAPAAGRIYAAYGGIYIVASLIWLVAVERFQPDRWDLMGATIALVGATIIIAAPR